MIQRFQLYFPVELYLRIKAAAAAQGTSIAAFMRASAEKALASARPGRTDPLDKIVGRGRAKDTDLSYRHDKYLYGWVKEAPKKRR